MADKVLKSITFPNLTDRYTIPQIDDTLSTTGKAADAKKVGDELTDLKDDLGELIISEEIAVARLNSYYGFDFVSGHTYIIINNTASSADMWTFTEASDQGEIVEIVKTNITAGETVKFTPTQNAPAFRFYAVNAGTIAITDVSVGVPALEKTVSELQNNADRTVFTDGIRQVTEKNTTFFTQSANLFDKDSSVDGYQINQAGTGLNAVDGFTTSDYIDVSDVSSVKVFEVGVAQLYVYYVLYDSAKTPLGNRTGTYDAIDTSTAQYIRISIGTGQKDIFMLIDSNLSPSQYIPYGFTFDYIVENETVQIFPADDVIQRLLDNKGKDIHFNAGVYDIIAQYENHFGSDYFTNYEGYASGGDNLGIGLPIYRGTKVTFSQGAIFTANYSGDNTAVRTNFSAFWLQSDVVIDGLRLSFSGIRNAIHDDFDNTYNGTTVIKNCHLSGDNNVIAGGLGVHDIVIIENCYIERTNGSGTYDFSYHNNGNAGAQSTLIVKDNYLGRGFSVRWYGQSTLMTDVLVSNNSMANTVDIHAENPTATIENINLKEWNNEIRN